jgi:hypothetical protein
VGYPETVAGVGLVNGGFVDENSLAEHRGPRDKRCVNGLTQHFFRSAFAPISAALASQRAWLNVFLQSRR